MLWGRRALLPSGYGARLEGQVVYLRPPARVDYAAWRDLRESSREFLARWEPTWTAEAHSRGTFVRRVKYAGEEWRTDQSYSFLIFRREAWPRRRASVIGSAPPTPVAVT
jgi:hypothetical protein